MTGVEVTQADRDAAEAFAEVLCLAAAKNGTLLHFTQNDDGILVQAFARYRHEARNAALEEAAKVAERSGELSNYSGRGSCCQGLGEDIATAIRAIR